MKLTYYFGRFLQIASLLAMPSAIWVAEFKHSEYEAIIIFLGSIVIFYVGWLINKVR